MNVARHSRTGLLHQESRKATAQPAHTPLKYRTLRDFQLEVPSFNLQNSTLWSYTFATHQPTWPRNYLLLVQRPGRQPFSKRHAQARNTGASHPFSFLVLFTVIHNGFSNILRAWIYAGYHVPVTITTTASQSCRAHINFTLYILHNLLSRIMETKTPHLHRLRGRLFHKSTRACYNSRPSESVPLQRKLQTRPILALDACQLR